MSAAVTNNAGELTFVPAEDMEAFFQATHSIFSRDMDRQTPPVPPYEPVMVARAAKTRDGRIAGGIVGKVLWNSFEVLHVAANPDCRVHGTETALLRWAEEAARGEFACNQIYLNAFSWRPRDFFEGLGYTLLWTHDNYPRGYALNHMEKTWTMESRGEPVQGYAGAATDLVMEDWDTAEATAQVQLWSEVERQQCGAVDVPAMKSEKQALNVLYPDGSPAAVCMYSVTWNVLCVVILAVHPGTQRRGVGSAILRKMDELACERGCDDIFLETMSWQARPFYEKFGYKHVATQHDLPMGFSRHAMLRRLPSPTAGNQ